MASQPVSAVTPAISCVIEVLRKDLFGYVSSDADCMRQARQDRIALEQRVDRNDRPFAAAEPRPVVPRGSVVMLVPFS